MEVVDKKVNANEVNISSRSNQPVTDKVKSESKISPAKIATGKIVKAEVDQNLSESEDEVPLSELLRKRALNSSTKSIVVKEINNDDTDDDIPIAELIKRKAANDAEISNKKQKIINSDSRKLTIDDIKAENSLKLQKKNNSNEKSKLKSVEVTTKPAINGTRSNGSMVSNFYQDSKKGYLVQQLLVRWWYAIEWPNLEEIGPPPKGYMSLDGFPGVFVSTNQENMGTLLDKRNKTTCPCLANYIKKPASEIQSLCIRAIEEQIRQLRESEGEDTSLEKRLKDELKQVKLINAQKAEDEAKKYSKMKF